MEYRNQPSVLGITIALPSCISLAYAGRGDVVRDQEKHLVYEPQDAFPFYARRIIIHIHKCCNRSENHF